MYAARAARHAEMSLEEYGRLLNSLLEYERAGAKLVAAYGDELPPDSDLAAWLSVIQRDEARNCSVLIHLLLEAGIEPTMAVAAFYRQGLQLRGWRERLRFLNRAHESVVERIEAALPQLASFIGRKSLQAMYDSHVVNMGICEQQLRRERA